MKPLLRIMIILLVLDIFVVVGIWYGFTLIQDKKNEEVALRTKIAEESQKGYRSIALMRTLAAVKGDRVELLSSLYDSSEEGQIRFITEIEQLGTTTTGSLVETKSLVLTKEDPPSLRGDFSYRGSWSSAYHLLRLLEEFPSRLVVNRFDVRYSPSEKIWNGNIQIDLSGLKMNK